MAGLASLASLETFLSTVQKSNPRAKIYQNKFSMVNVMFLDKDQLN
jgi:hypothetical protein